MNMKLVTFICTTLVATSSFASVREGGGVFDFKVLYQCTEVSPRNPADPVLATVAYTLGKTRLVLRTQSGPNKGVIYANEVQQNRTIRCIAACDVFDASKDQVRFSVNSAGKFNQATFQSPRGNLNFTCERGANY
jgi:hypothetical protein